MTAFHVLPDLLLWAVILAGALPLSFSLLLADSRGVPIDSLEDAPCAKNSTLARFLLILLVGWSVIQIGLGLLLGTLGQLKLANVVLAELLLFILGIVLISKTNPRQSNKLRITVNALRQSNRLALFVIYSIAMVGLFVFIMLVTTPVIDYDSLWFHLSAIARWYQTGSLTLLDPAGNWIFEHPDAAKYPYNWHILSLLCLLPFGTDVLVTVPNFLAWIMLGLAVYLLSQELGANQFYSLSATALLLSMPYLLDRVNTAQSDLALATLFVVSVYFAYSCYKTRSSVDFFLLLASAGLLSGIKITGIIYAAVAVGFWAVLAIFRRFEQPRSLDQAGSKNTTLIVLGWVALIVLGGYWYVHNSREAAIALNNLFSVVVADAEMNSLPKQSTLETILQKLNEYQKSTLTVQFDPTNFSHWKALTMQAVSRFQLPFVALALQIILLPYVWLKYPKSCWRRPFMIALMLFLITGFLYWNTPYSSGTTGLYPGERLSALLGYNMRYGFSGFAMGAVMAAVIATVMRPARWMVVAIVWLSAMISPISTSIFYRVKAQFFTGQLNLWPSLLIEQAANKPGQLIEFGLSILQERGLYAMLFAFIYAMSSLWMLRRKNLDTWTASFGRSNPKDQPPKSKVRLLRSAAVLVVLVGFVVGVGDPIRHQTQTKTYKGLHEYLEQTVGTSNKIAYFSSPRNYLLYGRNFQQIVLHKPVDLSNPNRWLEELRQEQIRFVAVGVDPQLNKQSAQGQVLQHLIKEGLLNADFGQDLFKELVVFRLQASGFDR